MNTYDERIFNRITELVSLLYQNMEEMTVKKIARLTESTAEQTRMDLIRLHTCGFRLSPAGTADRLARYDDRFDDIPLALDITLPGAPLTDGGILFLDPIERGLFLQRGIRDLDIKDTPSSASVEVIERAKKIEEAIRKNCRVHFRYKRMNSTSAETVETAPHFLYYNATDDLYYCISFRDGETVSFRLDRILFDVHLDRKNADPPDPDDPRLERFQYVWGAAFSSDEPVSHTKIRIEASTANILNKIRSDTARRRHASLYKEEDHWIYEDDVIGLNAFRSWLMMFGSSVKVLEPASLAEELYSSAAARLHNYEAGGIFDA